jgi:WD40 repeat protein
MNVKTVPWAPERVRLAEFPVPGSTDRDDRISQAIGEFLAASEQGRGDRSALLDKYNDVAEELAGCLEALDFMNAVAPQLGQAAAGDSRGHAAAIQSLATLGDFRILREIGRGGMGVVYEAEQLSIGRRVALKVLPFAAMLDKQQLNRFKNEARAAGTLDHPNIVAIYSVGSDRGVHYYAMQLIEGQSLAQVIEARRKGEGGRGKEGDEKTNSQPSALPLPPSTLAVAALSTLPDFSSREYFRTVAQLGIQAAEALDHAHQNGILHRDIKPANLLVDDAGKLWITDFGLARIELDAGMTMTGDLLGTLRYMSPEQALAKRVVVDHRSDIYSLGVTLYELLTQQPAFSGDDRQELLRQIAFDEPRKPRQINPRIPHDLETIILKAIEKNPADRYVTAHEFADDLRRFLDDQPIKAKPASYRHQLMKWSRRHVAVVWWGLAVSFVAATILGVSTALIAQSRNEANQQRLLATEEKDKAIDQRDLAKLNQYYAEIVSGQSDLQERNIARLHQKLIRHLPLGDAPDRRGWEWYYLFSFCHPEVRTLYHPSLRLSASWSPDGEYIAAAGAIWKAESGECVRLFTPSLTLTNTVAWSPDSQKYAWTHVSDDDVIYIWDRQTDSVRDLRGHESSVGALEFSPDGKQFAGALDNSVKVWDLNSGAVLRTFQTDNGVTDVAWRPDGSLLAAGVNEGGGVIIWSVATGETVARREADPNQHAFRLSWRPDGRQLGVTAPRYWYILDQADWKVVAEHRYQLSDGDLSATDIRWNPAGTQLALAQGNAVTLRDPATGQKIRTLAGHNESVKSIDWSPDGRQLVSGDEHRELRIWDLQSPPRPTAIATGGRLQRLSWDADSNTLVAVAAADLATTRWGGVDGKPVEIIKTADSDVKDEGVLSPDRRFVARLSGNQVSTSSVTAKPTITVRDAHTGAIQSIWRAEEPFGVLTYKWLPHESELNLSWSPDSSRLAILVASDTDEGLEIWDAIQEKPVSRWMRRQINPQDWDLHNPEWSPDGTRVVIEGKGDVGENGTSQHSPYVHIIDATTGKRTLKRLMGNRARYGGPIAEKAWSPDGRLLAIATKQGRIEVFDAETGASMMMCKAHEAGIHALAWNRDGNRLASASPDGIVKVIDRSSGGELLTLNMAPTDSALLAWSSDGRRLAAADNTGTIQVWDASRGYEFGPGASRAGELAWAYYHL